jgi:uncharacterized protein
VTLGVLVRSPLVVLAIVVSTLGLLAALGIAVKSYLGGASDFARWPAARISSHPEQTGIAGLVAVTFKATDGTALAGWYAPSRNRRAIVLAHGTNTDRSALLPETRLLAAAGFGVLAFDFPGQGASAGHTTWGDGERRALAGAVNWLAARSDVSSERIGGLGTSFGGVILAQVAALESRLRAVALISTPGDVVEETRLANSRWGPLTVLPAMWVLKRFGMDREKRPLDVIGEIAPRAVFIVGGELDTWVPESMTQELFAAAREPKELWIVPHGGHGGFADSAPRDYSDRLIQFFSRL